MLMSESCLERKWSVWVLCIFSLNVKPVKESGTFFFFNPGPSVANFKNLERIISKVDAPRNVNICSLFLWEVTCVLEFSISMW